MNRGHINQEAPWQGNVTGDARALLAERFLGNLDNDFLAGFQHFRDQLRAAWCRMATVVMASSARSAALESPASAIAATAIRASASIAPSEWPLETRARV